MRKHSLDDILTHAKTLGISLWMDNGNLRFKFPPGVLEKHPRALDVLKANKDAIIAYFEQQAAIALDNATQQYCFVCYSEDAPHVVGEFAYCTDHRPPMPEQRPATLAEKTESDRVVQEVARLFKVDLAKAVAGVKAKPPKLVEIGPAQQRTLANAS